MGGDGDRFSNQHIINLFGECFTWHRAIFSGGYPPNIVAADAFHNRVRDGSEWDHTAMDTRIDKHSQGVNPENCIGSAANAARLNQQRNESSGKNQNVGQALGLLVLLRCIHYWTST